MSGAVDVGYYTDADLTTSLKVLDEFESEPAGPWCAPGARCWFRPS